MVCLAQVSSSAQTLDTFDPGPTSFVFSQGVQADGKILVGGTFTTMGGQLRNRIARLNADGMLDSGFNPEANDTVFSQAVQADGKILVAGYFTTFGGQSRNRIVRLNADGMLDIGFNPGANQAVYSLAVQADGKILVGGTFTTMGGQARNRIARLNMDGTLDSGFNPGANDTVFSQALQTDGKILVGGSFSTLGGQLRNRIARLNADGTLDSGFDAGAADGTVYTVALQADGKLLVGGTFTTFGGQSRNHIARLNTDGMLDSAFNPVANDDVYSLAVQADGRTFMGGYFTTLGGQTRNRIARLNVDGTLDSAFASGANDGVRSLAVHADGKLLVGGAFTTLGGQSRQFMGRFNNTEPATQALSYNGSTITWLRGGTSPEAWRTAFDYSTNGSDWTFLGNGQRTIGGWELVASNIILSATIRARGFLSGGVFNASSGIAETTLNPDADRDGIADGWEAANGLNPLVNDAHEDQDLDAGDAFLIAEYVLQGANTTASRVSTNTILETASESFGLACINYIAGNNAVLFTAEPDGSIYSWIVTGPTNPLHRQLFSAHLTGKAWHQLEGHKGLVAGEALTGLWVDPTNLAVCNLAYFAPATELYTPPTFRQTAPVATILPAPNSGQTIAPVAIRLWDAEGNLSLPQLQVSTNSGSWWSNATIASLNGGALVYASAAPTGTTHSVLWNAAADLGAGYTNTVQLRLRARDNSLVGNWSPVVTYFVDTTVPPNPDSDGDGIPDDWENLYFGNLSRSGTNDFDGDGALDLAEFVGDTNPTNAASYLRFTGVLSIPSGLKLDWLGGSNATQYLQRSFLLGAGGTWSNLITNLPPTPINGSYTDTLDTNVMKFYRFEVMR